MVFTACKWRVWWSAKNIIPCQYVLLIGRSPYERRRFLLHGDILFRKTFVGSFGGHDMLGDV